MLKRLLPSIPAQAPPPRSVPTDLETILTCLLPADLAGDVTVSVASLADLTEVITAGVTSSADLAGDVTAGVAS